MFTGIIQDIGRIAALRTQGDNLLMTIASRLVGESMKIGDSISISGVCLTATAVNLASHQLTVTAVPETLQCTTIGGLRTGSQVNLELALRPNDRLGGHFVQGHVDVVGKCERIDVSDGSWEIAISFAREFRALIVEKGSIAIEGVSLTAYGVSDTAFKISVIPHTLQETTLQNLKVGDDLNLEFDILGKYIQRLLKKSDDRELSLQMLKDYGY